MDVRPKRKLVVTLENHDFTQNLPPPIPIVNPIFMKIKIDKSLCSRKIEKTSKINLTIAIYKTHCGLFLPNFRGGGLKKRRSFVILHVD